MKVGLIGVGVVGGTLKTWFEQNTKHEIACVDPGKGLGDSLEECDAVFISVPVVATKGGQELCVLKDCVETAKKYCQTVFIRSSVLPGTSDSLGCIAMPEFLTERCAQADMDRLPILVGKCDGDFLQKLFPSKQFLMVSNAEAELAKYAHNCFGAMKVTYFNVIAKLAREVGANFDNVKAGAFLTGYIEKQHTMVPGPDGMNGYGGKCFPENVSALTEYLRKVGMVNESEMFHFMSLLNLEYRHLRGAG